MPLLGAVCFGLGVAGSEGFTHDPQIDLTVLSEKPDGRCVVRWTDPFDGRERTGPYRCDPDREPELHDRETGFVVSYGPWKGDLYNAEWEGTAADDVNAAVGLSGLALLAVGRRRADSRVRPATAVASRVDPTKSPEDGGEHAPT
ncbi:hypothetical protein ACWCXB_22925 [Streptomyces sp. NPDC001514]